MSFSAKSMCKTNASLSYIFLQGSQNTIGIVNCYGMLAANENTLFNHKTTSETSENDKVEAGREREKVTIAVRDHL